MTERQPTLSDDDERVTVAHGAGTARMREFLTETVQPAFGDERFEGIGVSELDDGAVLPDEDRSLVVTTDSHVVDPLTFPGGDIGQLAVAGTVNDLAAMGATDPVTITCGLVLAAGTPIETVDGVLESIQETATTVGTQIHTGDTKVLPADALDGIVINTTGVGSVPSGDHLPTAGVTSGDKLIVTGPVGAHGIALLSAREGFEFDSPLESDVAPVNHLVEAAVTAGRVHAATDPTRGGLATALIELATSSGMGIELDERAVPIDDATNSAAEVLGIDPLTAACEGRMVLSVASDDSDDVIGALRRKAGGDRAAVIGKATDDHHGRVVVDTGIGKRYLTEPTGEERPRIC